MDFVEKKVERPWGYYRVLLETGEHGKRVKLKELTVNPGCRLSMQKHEHRAEYWFVAEGVATVIGEKSQITLDVFQRTHILNNQWHQLANNTDKIVRIIEIQYGDECIEEDIIRNEI